VRKSPLRGTIDYDAKRARDREAKRRSRARAREAEILAEHRRIVERILAISARHVTSGEP
jgi:hypothetical protein